MVQNRKENSSAQLSEVIVSINHVKDRKSEK